MKYLKKFNESTRQDGERINWNTWNNEMKRNTVPFTDNEMKFLQSKKDVLKDMNYETNILKDHIIFSPIKCKDIYEPKAKIFKHDGFYVIQKSKMWKTGDDYYEERGREVYKCIAEDISFLLRNYNVL